MRRSSLAVSGLCRWSSAWVPMSWRLQTGQRCIVDGRPDAVSWPRTRTPRDGARGDRRSIARRAGPTPWRPDAPNGHPRRPDVRGPRQCRDPGRDRESALAAGADGIGPASHRAGVSGGAALAHRSQSTGASLEPCSARSSRSQPATVRLLDFGGDKMPPFLVRSGRRGVELLLDHVPPFSMAAARRSCGRGNRDRPSGAVPMVTEPGQVRAVARRHRRIAAREWASPRPVARPRWSRFQQRLDCGPHRPRGGLPQHRHQRSDRLQLGIDRFAPAARPAHHPAVLRLIAAHCRRRPRRGNPSRGVRRGGLEPADDAAARRSRRR